MSKKKKLSKKTRIELIDVLRQRYLTSSRIDKSRILDEFTKMSGYHRKHGIRLMKMCAEASSVTRHIGRRVYGEAVKEALIVAWESADRICGKRLRSILPDLTDAMERHEHINLEKNVRQLLLTISASTIDRILAPIKRTATPQKKR